MLGYRILHTVSRRALQWTLFLGVVGMVGAQAQEIRVDIDPAKTAVTFTLDATMHTVHGTFKLKSGSLQFDLASGAASGQFVLDATSAETGNSGRDKKMHKDVLESAKYPEITFAPKQVIGKVELSGASKVDVQGTIGIHGQEHPITMTFPVTIDGDQVTATTEFSVPYQAWGMKNPSNLFLHVKDTVQLTIHATGRVAH